MAAMAAMPAMLQRGAVAAATSSATATPAIDPTLEIRSSLYRRSQTAAPQAAASGESASATPSPVATPLPPRKPSHTGKQWPITAPTPHAAAAQGSARVRSASSAGRKPLRASSSSVTSAAVRPAARATLVAPMFPDPTVRTSLPEAMRATSRPNGAEPAR